MNIWHDTVDAPRTPRRVSPGHHIARYGLTVQDVEMVVESAIGGANITTTIEGRERFPVNVRYQRHYRSDVNTLRRTLISVPGGLQIPIEQVADISLTTGPTVIRTEQAQLLGYVYVDVAGRDIGSCVDEAKQVVTRMVKLPEGYYLEWSGQYEYMLRAKERPKMMTVMAILMGLLPITWSAGAGADVMKRIAAPMVGGVITSFILELLIYPVIFTIWKWHSEVTPAIARTS